MPTYRQRHYGRNKLYVAVYRDKVVASVSAYNKAEAARELREKGVKFTRLRQS